jgi:hypothetical protein
VLSPLDTTVVVWSLLTRIVSRDLKTRRFRAVRFKFFQVTDKDESHVKDEYGWGGPD